MDEDDDFLNDQSEIAGISCPPRNSFSPTSKSNNATLFSYGMSPGFKYK